MNEAHPVERHPLDHHITVAILDDASTSSIRAIRSSPGAVITMTRVLFTHGYVDRTRDIRASHYPLCGQVHVRYVPTNWRSRRWNENIWFVKVNTHWSIVIVSSLLHWFSIEFFDNFTNYSYSGVNESALTAGCTSRLAHLARPKTAAVGYREAHVLPREVSEGALQARPTNRVNELAKPRHSLKTYKKSLWNNGR